MADIIEYGPSIYEVNARLFQIITYMSEVERGELQSVLIAGLDETEKQKELSVLIIDLSESEKRNLLNKLENWHNSKLVELREYFRKPSLIPAECSSDGVKFTDFIQDISQGGVFIQTDGNFYVDQQITMTFSLPKVEKGITISGKIVRIDSRGIGVQFNELLPDI